METIFNRSSLKIVFSAKRILIGTFLIIFIMIAFVVFRMQNLAISSAYSQIYSSNQATLDFFVQSLDNSISYVNNAFYNLLSDNSNISMLEIESDEAEIFEMKLNISQNLKTLYESNELLESVFLYSPAGSGQEIILYTTKLLTEAEGSYFKEYAIRACEASLNGTKFSSSDWTLHIIKNVPYLMRIVCVSQTFCGGFIRLDTIQNQISDVYHDSLGSSACFTMDNELVLGDPALSDLPANLRDSSVVKGQEGNYIFSYATPEVLDVKLAIAVPTSSVSNQSMASLTGFIGICAILILLVLFVYICLFFMYRPFLYLANSMKIVADGNLNFRITKRSAVHETDKIYRIFNTMLNEMDRLKTEIYEKELEKEKVTKQFLKMQLKSHFFLNCLNIIYSLAQTKRYELIQKLTICLVKYFRYLSLNNEELVELKAEIDHIQNYMEIQMMRFPGQIVFSCDIEEELYQCKIPMLILQTFLENAVKYGIDFSMPSPIALRAISKKEGETDGILFTIIDQGEGFSEELLEFYSHKDSLLPANQEHGIGIINVKNRLHLIYGGSEKITIANHLPTGAKIEIWIPKRGGK